MGTGLWDLKKKKKGKLEVNDRLLSSFNFLLLDLSVLIILVSCCHAGLTAYSAGGLYS